MKSIFFLLFLFFIFSCNQKDVEYEMKYENLLSKEDLYIDSIGQLPYVGVSTMDKLSTYTNAIDKSFDSISRTRTDDRFKPSTDQLKRHLELIKLTRFYIEGADLSKK